MFSKMVSRKFCFEKAKKNGVPFLTSRQEMREHFHYSPQSKQGITILKP